MDQVDNKPTRLKSLLTRIWIQPTRYWIFSWIPPKFTFWGKFMALWSSSYSPAVPASHGRWITLDKLKAELVFEENGFTLHLQSWTHWSPLSNFVTFNKIVCILSAVIYIKYEWKFWIILIKIKNQCPDGYFGSKRKSNVS